MASWVRVAHWVWVRTRSRESWAGGQRSEVAADGLQDGHVAARDTRCAGEGYPDVQDAGAVNDYAELAGYAVRPQKLLGAAPVLEDLAGTEVIERDEARGR